MEHANIDVNYRGEITAKNAFNEDVTGYYIPLIATCDKGFVDAVKYLVKWDANVNLVECGRG